MKFTFLLFILYLKLKKAAKKDPEFQEYIKKEKTKVLIKTADGKRGRMFIFDNGKFSSVPGADQKGFDVAMVWKDANTAFKVMASEDLNESSEAAYDGRVVFEGDANQALWFTGATTFIMGKKK
jgi:hypothetical protein